MLLWEPFVQKLCFVAIAIITFCTRCAQYLYNKLTRLSVRATTSLAEDMLLFCFIYINFDKAAIFLFLFQYLEVRGVKVKKRHARHLTFLIQGVPGGKDNILGGHCIGHSKQKTLYEHVSYSLRFPR
jgi:hypothetical protein